MSLINEAKKGNSEAFVTLIEQHKLQMYKTAKAILKNEEDVCDAIQDTMMSAYSNISQLKYEKYFKTWLIRITINKCYSIIEKNCNNNSKVQKQIMEYSEKTEDFENNMELERALNLLEEDLRTVTVLFYYDDISVKQISEILEIPVGTVKSRLSRSREKLYDILKQEEVS